MCNLYSLTKGQAAIRDWFRAGHDRTGNLPLFPGIFPDQFAPVVRKSLRRSLSHFVRRPGFRPARLREVLP
jgi:hypothetical protein